MGQTDQPTSATAAGAPFKEDDVLGGLATHPEKGSDGLGPTLGPDLREGDSDGSRRAIERGVYERRTSSAAQGGSEPGPSSQEGARGGEPLGSQIARAGIDLDASVLSAPDAGGGDAGPTAGDIGGANAAGFGASVGAGANRVPDDGSAAPGALNEQQGARAAHASGQAGGPGAAPDQSRTQGTLGSLNNTQGA